jgi:hypothetical protein
MDAFTAVVLATDQGTEALLDRKPDKYVRVQEVENKDNGDQVRRLPISESPTLGFVALPLGSLIRLIPNEACERVFVKPRLGCLGTYTPL